MGTAVYLDYQSASLFCIDLFQLVKPDIQLM